MDAGQRRRFGKIKIFLVDADGVLTDGAVYLGESGSVLRRFQQRDWNALADLQSRGIDVLLWLSSEDALLAERARAAGVGTASMSAAERIALVHRAVTGYDIGYDNIAVMTADPADLDLMEMVGLACAPESAPEEVRAAANYVCRTRGGEGAIREVADLVLDGVRRFSRRKDELAQEG